MTPLSAVDAARYLLRELGPLPPGKLQKLLYYCQVWSLVWQQMPLFHEPMETSAHGPVIPSLADYCSDHVVMDESLLPCSSFETAYHPSPPQKETMDRVIRYYGYRSTEWLKQRTCAEAPWDYPSSRISSHSDNREIDLSTITAYYSSL